MEAQVFRARAELCLRLLAQAKRQDVREALTALAREYEEAAAVAEFQGRACGSFPVIRLGS